MPSLNQRIFRDWFFLFSYLGLIFYLSHQPEFGEITETPILGKKEWTLHHPFINKIVHVIEYFPGTILFYRALSHLKNDFVLKNTLLLSAVLTFLYGVSDEIHQTFVPGRGFEVMDLVANSVAILLSVLFIKKVNVNELF